VCDKHDAELVFEVRFVFLAFESDLGIELHRHRDGEAVPPVEVGQEPVVAVESLSANRDAFSSTSLPLTSKSSALNTFWMSPSGLTATPALPSSARNWY
jgi:hypothetical protein